jgi:polyisoprenoid-binding protein YceI
MSRFAIGLVAAALPLTVFAATESFTIDGNHSYPHFQVNHLGFMNLIGRFDKMSGKIVMDAAGKTGSVDIAIETASVSTGDSEKGSRTRSRDEHLRTPDFFNVAEFPRATFKGTATKWTGEWPAAIEGQLTLLGVTRPLTLTVENWKCGPDPRSQGKRYMCGGNASGVIKRSEFGMKFGVGPIGDEVKLMIGVEAFRDQ